MENRRLRLTLQVSCVAILTAVLLAATNLASMAAAPKKLTVICSNDTVGTLEPCG